MALVQKSADRRAAAMMRMSEPPHEDWGRRLVKKLVWGHVRLALSLVVVLLCGVVRAEDIDQGKSAQKLFADSCAACHKSARGLTKRGSIPLYFFLRDHYTTSSTSAWAMTSYLESIEGPPQGHRRKSADGTPSSPQAKSTAGAPRPPAAVPQHQD
jgi:hypothetical protein